MSFCKDIAIFDENVMSYNTSFEKMGERNLEIQIDSDDTTEMYCVYLENYFAYYGIVVTGSMQKELIADFNKYKEWRTKAIQLKTVIEKPIDTIDVEKAFFQTVDQEWHPCLGYKRLIIEFVSDNPTDHYLRIKFVGFKNSDGGFIVTEVVFLSIDNVNMLIKSMNQSNCNTIRKNEKNKENMAEQFK
jgi:hypothetical protein